MGIRTNNRIRVLKRTAPTSAPTSTVPVLLPFAEDFLKRGFSFTPEVIADCLRQIAHKPGFREIRNTIESCSSYQVKKEKPKTVFEWFNVTSIDSPLMRRHLHNQGEGRSVFLYPSKDIKKNPAYVLRIDSKGKKIGIDLFGRDSTKELYIADSQRVIFSDWSKNDADAKILTDIMTLVSYGLLKDPRFLNWMFTGIYNDEFLHL